jgi:hypothetical protein
VWVVGFDDVQRATMLSAPLTTMHPSCREIEVVALRALLDRIADPAHPPRSLTLSPSLCASSLGAVAARAGARVDAAARGWERERERHACAARRVEQLLAELGELLTEEPNDEIR